MLSIMTVIFKLTVKTMMIMILLFCVIQSA